MSDVHAVGARPLPARPNLAFERKAAKALLAALRADDADAWGRARAIDPRLSPAPKLADAQRVVAREYGFASWARLVRYFEIAERVGEPGTDHDTISREDYARSARNLLVLFENRVPWFADALAAYIPRFFGRASRTLWTETVTEADAQLIVARQNGLLSWDALVAQAPEHARERENWSDEWRVRALRAVHRGDLPAVQALCAQYPELLTPSSRALDKGDSLIAAAVHAESTLPRDVVDPILGWLATHGMSVEDELTRQLWRRMFLQPAELRALLERGVDPNRTPAHGVPILELALLRLWPRETVDLLATRCTPRPALWIAAGLGDVAGMRRLLDAAGRPVRAAYDIRPAWELAHRGRALPATLDPSPEDRLFEALFIAVMNDRVDAAVFLAEQGAPLNRVWGDMTPLAMAVGARGDSSAMLEALLKAGADPDAPDASGSRSARQTAKWLFLDSSPRAPIRATIARLLGWDPEALLTEVREKLARDVPLDTRVRESLQQSAHDAHHQGASVVEPLHLLLGIARTLSGGLLRIQHGVDASAFHASFAARLDAPAAAEVPELPLSPASEAVLDRARAVVRDQARRILGVSTLLVALLDDPDVARVMRDHGADVAAMQRSLARG